MQPRRSSDDRRWDVHGMRRCVTSSLRDSVVCRWGMLAHSPYSASGCCVLVYRRSLATACCVPASPAQRMERIRWSVARGQPLLTRHCSSLFCRALCEHDTTTRSIHAAVLLSTCCCCHDSVSHELVIRARSSSPQAPPTPLLVLLPRSQHGSRTQCDVACECGGRQAWFARGGSRARVLCLQHIHVSAARPRRGCCRQHDACHAHAPVHSEWGRAGDG